MKLSFFLLVRKPFVIVAIHLVLMSVSYADESSMGVSLPALLLKPRGSVVPNKAEVWINGDNTRVAFELSQNPTMSKDIRLILDFPKLGWWGESETYSERQFPELAVTVNGQPADINDGYEVYMGNQRITSLVDAAEIDPWAITQTPPFVTVKQGKNASIIELERIGALVADGSNYVAQWKSARMLQIKLPDANASVLELSYIARPASKLASALDGAAISAWLGNQCSLTRESLYSGLGLTHATMQMRLRRYLIPVSIDGRAPRFARLHVSASSLDDVRLIVCTPAGTRIGSYKDFTDVDVSTGKNGVLRVIAAQPISVIDAQ
jgi:hypothetical protein